MGRVLLLLLAAAFGLAAQHPYSVLPADVASAFQPGGLPEDSVSIVPVEGQSFSWAWRLRTPAHGPINRWDYRLAAYRPAAVGRGDTMLAVFWMRTLHSASGTGFATFVTERSSQPWTKSVVWIAVAGPEWRKFEIPFSMAESYAVGEYAIEFFIAFDEQEIEIGGLSVTDYGPNISWRDLHLTGYPYAGYAPGAAWRAKAAQRIEKYRKGDIIVVVRDDNGNRVPNAGVRVKMKRHAFRFGSAVSADMINNPREQEYQNRILKLFNSVTIENALKWRAWDKNRNRGLHALAWFHSHGINRVRGHNIVWPTWTQVPDSVKPLQNHPEQLRQVVRAHVTDIATATCGQVIDWDVVNEPVHIHDLQDILGEDEMAEWYRLTRLADPDVKLFLNDYYILTRGGWDVPAQDEYARIINMLDSLGAPLDGVGLQSHFENQLTGPERVWEILDRYAAFGKDLLITEFDIHTTDEQLQADYTRDFLTTVFSHPAVKGFYMWGFWEGRHWRPDAAMYRRDWSPKPNALVYNDLVFKQWWTDAEGTTGADGIFRTRGFLGEYEISVTHNGTVQTTSLDTGARPQPSYAAVGRSEPGVFTAASVLNGASFHAGPVAPGEIVTIYGTGFGSPELAQAAYEDGLLQGWAGDTKVYFDGIQAPMIYSLSGQISAIVPYSVSGSTRIEVEYLGTKTDPVAVPVAATAPGIFCYSAGRGQAVAINNGSVFNGPDHPVHAGDHLTFFLTGEGAVTPAIGDGRLPKGPHYPAPARWLGVYISGIECPVEFAGLIYAGVTQVNVRVPDNVPSDDAVSLRVLIGGVASPDNVTIAVR